MVKIVYPDDATMTGSKPTPTTQFPPVVTSITPISTAGEITPVNTPAELAIPVIARPRANGSSVSLSGYGRVDSQHFDR